MSPLLLLTLCSLAAALHAQTVDSMLKQLLTDMATMNSAVSGLTVRIARTENRQLTSELLILNHLKKLQIDLNSMQQTNTKIPQDFKDDIKLLTAAVLGLRTEVKQCSAVQDTSKIDNSLNALVTAASITQSKIDAVQKYCQSGQSAQNTQLQYLIARLNTAVTSSNQQCVPQHPPVDCAALYASGEKRSGVYFIQPPSTAPTRVFCDKGWTIIQRREANDVSFDQKFVEYTRGFGKVSSDHWVGLEILHALTAAYNYTLRAEVRLDDDSAFNKRNYARYSRDGDGKMKYVEVADFAVGAGPDYRLRARGVTSNLQYYSGAQKLESGQDGKCFSTSDRDNDGSSKRNRAAELGAGWWFADSTYVDFNGDWSKHCGCSAHNDICFWLQNYYGRSVTLKIKR